MHLADNYKKMTAHNLVHSSRKGLHTLPPAMLDDYDQLMQLIEDGHEIRDNGARRWASKKAEQAAEEQAVKLQRLGTYGGTDALITGHIAPAVDDAVTEFRTNQETAGTWGRQITPSLAMLELDDETRAAIIRVHTACAAYDALRRVWALLRGGINPSASGSARNVDPHGSLSILGEVRNIDALVPHWRTAGRPGNDPWPWGGTSSFNRLTWVLDHGGHIWTPTAREHDAVWCKLRDADLEARRGPGPRRSPLAAHGTAAA